MDCSRARTRDPRDWLETCPDFSWPLAEQVHEWILTWEPDLTEAIKWNMLCFSGRKRVVALSACQRHLGITFFRGTELADPAGLFAAAGENNTNIRTIRITTLEHFNRPALQRLVHAAVALDSEPLPPLPKTKRPPFPMPDFFRAASAQPTNRAAAEGFAGLAPTYQREYLVWLASAKRPETRMDRLRKTLEALRRGRKWADHHAH
jgi:uncharacterized protein YdeI (YjbR/CyaY-like superfamily)